MAMALAVTGDERALEDAVRSFLQAQPVRRMSRARYGAPGDPGRPGHWSAMSALGCLGVHVPEEDGGQGGGLPELAIVLHELGRALAPGPHLTTVLASALLTAAGPPVAGDSVRSLVPGLAGGSLLGAVGLCGAVRRTASGLTGTAGHVLGAHAADVLLLAVGDDLAVLDVRTSGDRVVVEGGAALDASSPTASVRLTAAVPVAWLRRALPTARRLARLLAAAEATGVGRACLDLAVEHVGRREQFGRAVGAFQAVKHRCADMLIDNELAASAVWDAARAPGGAPEADLAAASAACRALPAAVRSAEACVQLHGALGFSWEHDAHLFLRRARSLAAFVEELGDAPREVTTLARAGVRREPAPDLAGRAHQHRTDVRRRLAAVAAMGRPADQRAALVDSGDLVPHWPPPFGRGADAVEQLVVEQEVSGLGLPALGISGWVAQTVAQHGSVDQQERWVRSTLRGELTWCQMFSEPGAGSDAAAVRTRGVRSAAGWRVTGQKTWVTAARDADRGFATVRTEGTTAGHAGVTVMAIDLRAPGVTVRPVRQITGASGFCEVFLDDVLVPDRDVVGEVGGGWRVARATLGNERVSAGGHGRAMGTARAEDLLEVAARTRDPDRWAADIGALLAEAHARRSMLLRSAALAVDGTTVRSAGCIDKVVASEHAQRVAGLGLRMAGMAAVAGEAPERVRDYLWSRCLTIAGGTSEIARDQVAERLLGLPRDPGTR